jgi:hypothetical protein
MVKITQMLLGGGLLLLTALAVAGPLIQSKNATATDYPECQDVVHRAPNAMEDAGRGNRVANYAADEGGSGVPNAAIDEYLSFHAQVTEDNGKFSLMPWSGLRTHAN